MKQLILPIAIVAGLLLFAQNTSSNIQPELLELSVNRKLTNLRTMVLDAKIRIVNASPVPLRIDSILGSVSYKNVRIAAINDLGTKNISAKAFTEFVVLVYIDTLTAGGDMITAYMDYRNKIVPVVRVQARINTPFGSVVIDKLQPLT